MSNIKSIDSKIILSLISLFGSAVSFVLRDKPYGIVKQRKEIMYNGQQGWLVWDYIIYNEITLEYDGNKISMFNSMSDDETQKTFDELLKIYPMK